MAGAGVGLRWVLMGYFLAQRPQSPELEDKAHLFFCWPLARPEHSGNGNAIKYGTKIHETMAERGGVAALCRFACTMRKARGLAPLKMMSR